VGKFERGEPFRHTTYCPLPSKAPSQKPPESKAPGQKAPGQKASHAKCSQSKDPEQKDSGQKASHEKTRLKITSVITRVHKSISIRTQGSK
jgi:hypothetical protein